MTVDFWMDRFCIPTDSPSDQYWEDLKARAMGRMALVYAGAGKVLVLDSQIQMLYSESHQSGWNNDMDIAADIPMSAWMQRRWTLQEAVLAWSCYFMLANGAWRMKSDIWLQAAARKHRFSVPLMVEREGQRLQELFGVGDPESQMLRGPSLVREAIRRTDAMTRLVTRELQDDKRWHFTGTGTSAKSQALTAFRVS
jgi:hypothetical protein